MRTFQPTFVFLLVTAALACSRERPVDVSTTTPAPPPASPPSAAAKVSPSVGYDEALDWFRTTKGFHFVLEDAGMRAEGDMVRPAMGTERVRMTIDGAEWLAAAGRQGVTWYRREGSAWKPAAEPENGGRLYQRVTVAFDPQKREGSAQHAGGDLYRFTNANSGELHTVRVTNGRIIEMTIGDAMKLAITKHDAPGDVPVP
jgi:hypothetical protein